MCNLRLLLSIIILLAIGYGQAVVGQETKRYSAKEALAIFKEGDYVEAEQAYAYLLKSYDRQIKYNYYYGICLIQNNHDLSQAVKRLKYAALKGVSRDAYYYLGRAYQLTYQFEEAIKQYSRFLKYASASDIRNGKAELYRQECEFGMQHAAKIYHLEVYGRDTVDVQNVLSAYRPAKDVGKVTYNKDFFESGLDPNGILYLTERGDEVYFSMGKGEEPKNLYKMEKLLDGWSESKALDGINSASNEVEPFVLIDGATIYFSSNREGGFGGYDLYRANYDAESKTFTEPVNLGIPFNSPKDDHLFVADEFNQVAWFASNRETNDSTLLVYTIKWDESVVKNFVNDFNEIKEEAALKIAEGSIWSDKEGGADANKNVVKKEKQFYFVVADTLEYSHPDHFKSDQARQLFTQGMTLQFQKDSLSHLMKEKRAAYARSNSETELSMLVNDILLLEKNVYGIDAKIERSFYQARLTEQNKIKELVAAGEYSAPTQVKVEKKSKINYKEVLIPEEYSFYTDEEFARELEELEKMYHKLFDAEDIKQLKRADSLFIWGNILNLESSKILENASEAGGEKENLINLIKRNDSLDDSSPVQGEIEKAKELKMTALKLYHESLDIKQRMYSDKIHQTLMANSVADLSALEQLQSEGAEYFKEAGELVSEEMGFDILLYEKAGTIKRNGVKIQEKGLMEYSGATESNEKIEVESPKKTIPKTYQELQGGVEEKEPAKVVENAFRKSTDESLVYKIQIGVFRNEPNKSSLAKIPAISKIAIPDRDLTKYFAGNYSTYAKAQEDLSIVRAAGFEGAFVVVFKDGKQINLTEELKK
ncbi:MAG: hypothetical protein N4A71_00845 [Carboxylicivirga sp.]|jgi:hypothetical protein|nr:hypothetical protein [Carboxylicivirga sp.]